MSAVELSKYVEDGLVFSSYRIFGDVKKSIHSFTF